jgi:hypothetical protein
VVGTRFLVIAFVLAMSAACHYEDRRWAKVSVAWVTHGQLGLCLREYRQHQGRYPATLAELRDTVRSSTSYCNRVEERFFDDPSGDFVGFRYSYRSSQAGTEFLLESRPLYNGPHQCTLRMTQELVATRSCERDFPPWPRVDRTNWSSGAPEEVGP